MRNKYVLWRVVRRNFDKYFQYGLCGLIMELWFRNLLTTKERDILLSDLSRFGNTQKFFLGESGWKQPRIRFIEDRLREYSHMKSHYTLKFLSILLLTYSLFLILFGFFKMFLEIVYKIIVLIEKI